MKTAFLCLVAVVVFATAPVCVDARGALDLGDGGLYGEGTTLRDIQETIWFQGFLTDSGSGEPVNWTETITVRIYDAEMGGSVLWGPEAHVGVQIIDGWFNIELGSVIGGLPSFDAPPYYLHILVGAEALVPRLKMASVPSAFQSLAADDGLTLPYSGSYDSSGDVFTISNTGPNRAGYFRIDNPASSAGALYGSHNGTGAAVMAWHDGVGPAIRAVANGDGYAGLFEGPVAFEDSIRVEGLAMMKGNAVVLDTLMAGEGFWFAKDPVAGYVLRCADSWGNAEWGPPNVIDVHNENTSQTIGLTTAQYDDCEVSLTVPGPGYIVLTSNVVINLNHTNGTLDAVWLGHSTSPTTPPSFDTSVYHDVPSSYPSSSDTYKTFSVHSTHEVTSSGTKTYYLVGQMDAGGDPDDEWVSAQMTGIYYPYPMPVREGGVAAETADRRTSPRGR